MPDLKNYDTAEITRLYTESENFQKILVELTNTYTDICNKLDSRIKKKYKRTFLRIEDANNNLKEKIGNSSTKTQSDIEIYREWLNSTKIECEKTINETEKIANSYQPLDIDSSLDNSSVGTGGAGALGAAGIESGLDNNNSGTGDADKTNVYKMNPETIKNLPPKTQEVIKTKLKELGFTDKEIESILNGEVKVNKVELDALSSKLETALKTNPALRQELIEIYGFDIFNEDGTVNKDKLALAMIMDAKNPNDQYDLNALFKNPSNGNENNNNNTENEQPNEKPPIPDDIINGIIDNVTGGTKPGDGNGIQIPGNLPDNIKDFVDNATEDLTGNLTGDLNGKVHEGLNNIIGAIKNPEELITLGEDLKNNTISAIKPEGILPTIDTEVKSGNFGSIASLAGLGTAIAATAGGVAISKKKKDKNRDSDNDEKIEFISKEDRYEEDEANKEDEFLPFD